MPFRPKPINLGIDGMMVYRIFVDIAAKDAFFTLHPEVLVNNMFIYIAEDDLFQKYVRPGEYWEDQPQVEGYWLFVK